METSLFVIEIIAFVIGSAYMVVRATVAVLTYILERKKFVVTYRKARTDKDSEV